jgi:hypothetical protein
MCVDPDLQGFCHLVFELRHFKFRTQATTKPTSTQLELPKNINILFTTLVIAIAVG